MIVLLQVLAVLAVVFGVAVVLTGRTDGLSEEAQDLADTGIPRDRAMTPRDVVGLRFALAFRGYRMNEVDDALDRLAAELAARDEEIQRLRAEPGRAEPEPAVASGWERTSLPDPEPAAEPAREPAPWELALPPLPELEPDVPEPAVAEVPVPDPDEDAAPEVAASTMAEPEYAAELEPEFAAPPPAAEPEVLAEADAPAKEAPIFGSLTPPADGPNPFRPEVPEIPAYDPWAVTPKSRYTEGPTYVDVDDETDDDETVDAIAEHHTGYAPPPETTSDDNEERPPPPWQR